MDGLKYMVSGAVIALTGAVAGALLVSAGAGYAIYSKLNSADVHFDRAYRFSQQKDDDHALVEYSKAIELDRTIQEAFFNRALIYEGKGDWDRAISDFSAVIELKPNDAKAFYCRGGCYVEKGDRDRAISDYSQAINLKEDYAKAYGARGYEYKLKGDLDAALKDYTKLIVCDLKNAGSYSRRGVVYVLKGDYESALHDFQRAMEVDPSYAYAYMNRGVLRCMLELWKDGLDDLRKVCELHGRDEDHARFWIWLARSRQGDGDAAIQELKKYLAIRKAVKKNEAWILAIGRFLSGEIDEKEFFKAAETNKGAGRSKGMLCAAYFYAGSKHLIEGDKARAQQLFKDCVATEARQYIEYVGAVVELKRLDEVK